MKITTKGIGWLIFGLIVCGSCTEAHSVLSAVSSIVWGIVFIGIYVMRQFFKPRGIGWYIGGGTLLAFCIENGADSSTLMPLLLGVGFLYVFYAKNKAPVDAMVDGVVTDEPDEEYEEDGITETVEVVEVVETTVVSGDEEAKSVAPADESDAEIEFEELEKDEMPEL